VIPQLTADTMRHHRTTNRAVPHGKRMRRTGRFRGFAFVSFAGCTLGRLQSFGRRRSGTFESTSPGPSCRSNTPGLVYRTSNRHSAQYTCTHPACIPSSAARRPPCAAQSASPIHPQARRPRRAWFQKPHEMERLGLHINRLGISWYTAAAGPQPCPFQIFPSSRDRRADALSQRSHLAWPATYLAGSPSLPIS
jgi:hypothetical protein